MGEGSKGVSESEGWFVLTIMNTSIQDSLQWDLAASNFCAQ